MLTKLFPYSITMLGIALLMQVTLNAQDIKKEVTVVKPYEPSLTAASKLNQMPIFTDTANIRPSFNYSIQPVKISAIYTPRPVNAAKMMAEQLDPLYKTYLKAGFGNPISPLAEVSVTNVRSKEYAYGIALSHYSASGDISINGKDVATGFADNKASLFGKKIMKKHILSGSVDYQGNAIHHYGYDPQYVSLSESDTKQTYHSTGMNLGFESTQTDSDKLRYLAKTRYNYFTDRFGNNETHIGVQGGASQNIMDFFAGTDLSINFYDVSGTLYTEKHTVVRISPWISHGREDWRFLIGFTLATDDKAYFYPRGRLDFTVVQEILSTYIGFDGYLQTNNYQHLAMTNNYIIPGLYGKSTNCRGMYYGGIKGSFSSAVSFDVQADYSVIDNHIFFINDYANNSDNQFDIAYGNAEVFKVSPSLHAVINKQISFNTRATYRNYNVAKVDKPWHIPTFDMVFALEYNLRNKIIVKPEVYGCSSRFAMDATSSSKTLGSYVDINLEAEYRYTERFSIFARINNLTAKRYEIWNQYPSYRFRFMAGVMYDF